MKLKDLRNKVNVTQFDACIATGVKLSTFARWEKGESRIPADVVPELARLYQTTEKAILDAIKSIKQKEAS